LAQQTYRADIGAGESRHQHSTKQSSKLFAFRLFHAQIPSSLIRPFHCDAMPRSGKTFAGTRSLEADKTKTLPPKIRT
jgi:hypothetical protein